MVERDCVFCKIVAGVIPSHRFWEDENHIAFLSIYPNTDGFVVIATKQHNPSYAFENSDEVLSRLVLATKKVAKILDQHFSDVARTGMFLEGMGVDHLHSKLSPMHGTEGKDRSEFVQGRDRKDFMPVYPGYLSSHDSEKADDKKLAELAEKLRKLTLKK